MCSGATWSVSNSVAGHAPGGDGVLPVKRPDAHPSHDAIARDLCAAIRAEVARHDGADFNARDMWTLAYEPKAKDWKSAWGERGPGLYKRALVGVERLDREAKCVWCEQLRSWRGELHVDHFRPKGGVTVWQGEPSEVLDEPPAQEPDGDGYWWLAHTWTNWNLACYECNAMWKRNLLPCVGRRPPQVEGVEESEVLLLLDPTSSFETRTHFRWDRAGYMFGRTEVGRATIITCGLNRKLLVAARMKKVSDVLTAVARFKGALAGDHDEAIKRELATIAALGDAQAEFAGMTRHLVETEVGDLWESLVER